MATFPATPPAFLQLGAHPLRWSLMRELSRGDHQVEELAVLTGQPQNLVSYHLGKLRAAEVVLARRSSRDAREVYYRLNVSRCASLLAAAGSDLHAVLSPALPILREPVRFVPIQAKRLLFLCTENSARSQMAEGLARHYSQGTLPAVSAGIQAGRVHPLAIRAMAAMGIDISGQRSKPVSEFADERFDLVVTVCDRAREACPEFLDAPERLHWSIPDPAADGAGGADFERVALELEERVALLLRTLVA